jgi:hypothetical protein
MTRIACPILLAAILLGPAAARADEAAAPAPEGRWYGWQLALSDTPFLLVAGDGRVSDPELPTGSAGYKLGLAGVIVGAPTIHYLHGNRQRAIVGLIVRGLAVPLWALAQNTNSGEHADEDDFFLVGLGIAATGAAVVFAFIDDIWYARAPAPAPARTTAIAPTWFMNRGGGGGIGVVGVF